MSKPAAIQETDEEIATGVTKQDIRPFIYDKDYPFVFCSRCKSGIIVPSARAHLLSQHREDVPEQQRNITAYSLTLLPNMAQSEGELDKYQAPRSVRIAIPYLECRRLFKCRECHYACSNRRNMQTHCRVEHDQHSERRVGAPSKARRQRPFWVPWRENVMCQRFFQSRKLRGWFEVVEPVTDMNPPDTQSR
jgi:hypothetical protein